MIERDWHGAYSEGWTGIITPDSFAHPAKFARGLIRRIYEHLFEQGYLKEGDSVVDPFGGVALGALHAMQHGCHWVGVELEQKFVDLGNQNIQLWLATYAAHFPRWGSAVLVQGDSRELVRVVGQVAGASVGSPPYAQTVERWGKERNEMMKDKSLYGRYGDTTGQLAALHEGDHAAAVQAAVSSSPYTASLASDDPDKRGGLFRDPKRRGDKTLTAEYGESAGQLGTMKEGDFAEVSKLDSSVTSPPYNLPMSQDHNGSRGGTRGITPSEQGAFVRYGNTPGQLEGQDQDTFWSAARTIVEQTRQVLTPGAVAVWVCKSFVRKKKRVDFPNQWRELTEACGFETIEWIRAWLVEDRGAQYTLFDGLDERSVERKSFFRRLYEFKARAAKFWQTVERDDKARHLWDAHEILWADYYQQLHENGKEKPPQRPTRGKILSNAQTLAYEEAGEPDIEIDTAIDYEVVIIQRRI